MSLLSIACSSYVFFHPTGLASIFDDKVRRAQSGFLVYRVPDTVSDLPYNLVVFLDWRPSFQ